ncbi:MAG: hypothetical protein A4S09_12850 [Proteobacteria bacterium SG_bin7]|nr:MAG: hypothetical protein A4S09_12850 [Proteobacteria bacterium SG_bin7]
MNLGEWIRFFYGITLGTSTPLIDIGARPLRNLEKKSLGNGVTAFIGGACNCVAIGNNGKNLLINSNMGSAAEEIFQSVTEVSHIVNQKAHMYFSAGNEFYTDARDIYVGRYPRLRLISVFGDRKVPNHVVSEKTEIDWGQKIILEPLTSGMFENNLVVYLPDTKTLMLGDLFYNRVFPIFKMHPNLNVTEWLSVLESVLSKYQPDNIIPAEGSIGNARDVSAFIDFLRDISLRGAKTSILSEKYKWENIAGLSSLELGIEAFKSDKNA